MPRQPNQNEVEFRAQEIDAMFEHKRNNFGWIIKSGRGGGWAQASM